jgi:hypothetical protein
MSFLAQSRIVFPNSFDVDAAHRLTPTPSFALLTVANQIGDAGAAAVAGALEPRRNADGSWTPSTALTVLWLYGEWPLIFLWLWLRKNETARVYTYLPSDVMRCTFLSPVHC